METKKERDLSIVTAVLCAARNLAAQGSPALYRDNAGVYWLRVRSAARAAGLSHTTAERVIMNYIGHFELVPMRAGTPLDTESARKLASNAGVDLEAIAEYPPPALRHPLVTECERLIAGQPNAFRKCSRGFLRFITREAAERANWNSIKLGASIGRLGMWDRSATDKPKWSTIGRPLDVRALLLWLHGQAVSERTIRQFAQAVRALEPLPAPRLGRPPKVEAPALDPIAARAKAQRELRAGLADQIERMPGERTAAAVAQMRAELAIEDDREFLIACGAGLPPGHD